jgi:tetratricopeptide (TPR) repeat protein
VKLLRGTLRRRSCGRLRFAFVSALCLILGTPLSVSAQASLLAKATEAFYRGDYAQAAQLAEEHLRANPKAAPARILFARAELAQGKLPQAFEQLKSALASDPRDVDALYYLSIIARELSQQEYQKLFAMAPDSDRVYQLLGEAALAAENKSEAETEFLNALKANPRSVDVATELAELKRSQSKFDEAISYYARAAQNGPLNYEISYGLGACYTYKQDYAQAVQWLRKAVAFDPESPAGRFALGNALFQSDEYALAIPELKASLKLEQQFKQAYFLLGRAYSKLGQSEEAKAAFQKLDEMNRAEIPSQEKGSTPPKPNP